MLRRDYLDYVDIIEEQLQAVVGTYPIKKRKIEKDAYVFTVEIHSEDGKYARDMQVSVNASMDVKFSCVLLENILDCLDILELINDLNGRLRFGKLYWHQGDKNELIAQYDVILAENPGKDLFGGQIFQICSLILHVFCRMIAKVQESLLEARKSYGMNTFRKIELEDVIIDPFYGDVVMKMGGETGNEKIF